MSSTNYQNSANNLPEDEVYMDVDDDIYENPDDQRAGNHYVRQSETSSTKQTHGAKNSTKASNLPTIIQIEDVKAPKKQPEKKEKKPRKSTWLRR